MVTVVFKSRKTTEIPEANLGNVKRMFGDQIAYVEDGDDEPIIAQPIIEVVEDNEPKKEEPKVDPPKKEEPKKEEPKGDEKVVAKMAMTSDELKGMAKDLKGYNAKMNKQQLVDLING